MTKALEDDLSCPIAFDQLASPIDIDSNGHIACSRKLSRSCPYADKGCTLSISEDHQSQFCQFRAMKCPMEQDYLSDLTGTGTVKDWLSHVKSSHGLSNTDKLHSTF